MGWHFALSFTVTGLTFWTTPSCPKWVSRTSFNTLETIYRRRRRHINPSGLAAIAKKDFQLKIEITFGRPSRLLMLILPLFSSHLVSEKSMQMRVLIFQSQYSCNLSNTCTLRPHLQIFIFYGQSNFLGLVKWHLCSPKQFKFGILRSRKTKHTLESSPSLARVVII